MMVKNRKENLSFLENLATAFSGLTVAFLISGPSLQDFSNYFKERFEQGYGNSESVSQADNYGDESQYFAVSQNQIFRF